MDRRLAVAADLDEDVLDALIPPFTMQPIVENAIRHGLSPKRAGGRLLIRARVDSGLIILEVQDDGVGCELEPARTMGLGTRAVAQRLTAQFGDLGRMSIDSAPGEGYRVRLSFPLVTI